MNDAAYAMERAIPIGSVVPQKKVYPLLSSSTCDFCEGKGHTVRDCQVTSYHVVERTLRETYGVLPHLEASVVEYNSKKQPKKRKVIESESSSSRKNQKKVL